MVKKLEKNDHAVSQKMIVPKIKHFRFFFSIDKAKKGYPLFFGTEEVWVKGEKSFGSDGNPMKEILSRDLAEDKLRCKFLDFILLFL
jgi:hypothetical protein